MALELNVSLNTNDSIEGVKGKYYSRVEYKGTMSQLELAKHMASHTTSFSKGEINGMLTDLVTCIKELTLLGYVIKIDDLGLFKASVESNGLTLKPGAKISAGVGQQRTDEELQADITKQQAAITCVKLIMQATGDTTRDEMTRGTSTCFTSKSKQLIKSLTGNEAASPESLTPESLTPDPSLGGEGSDNTGGNEGGDNGSGDNGGGGDDNGGLSMD